MFKRKSSGTFVAVCVTLLCITSSSARATTITVTNTNDSGPGSLRDALAIANDGDTIDATSISGAIALTSGRRGRHHARARPSADHARFEIL